MFINGYDSYVLKSLWVQGKSSMIFNLTIESSWHFNRRFWKPCFLLDQNFMMIEDRKDLQIRLRSYYEGMSLFTLSYFDSFSYLN
jgi:hypothetical protein